MIKRNINQALKMARYRIFDLNIHLTANEKFKDYRRNIPCNFDTYCSFLNSRIEFLGGLLVGLPNVGDYSDSHLIKMADELSVPALAAVTNELLLSPDASISRLKSLGFIGVKFHERLLNIPTAMPELLRVGKACKRNSFVLAICTFQEEKLPADSPLPVLEAIEELSASGVKLILMHSGGNRFEDFFDFCRERRNILLDLSFTLRRYVDHDVLASIIRAARTPEHNLAFGSDFPDYNLADYMRPLKFLESNISSIRAFERLTHGNAMDFLGLERSGV